MKRFLIALWFTISGGFRRTYRAHICKHYTKLKGYIPPVQISRAGMGSGGDFIMEIPLETRGNPNYCLHCIGQMSILCVLCGDSIPIGRPVAVSSPVDDSCEVPSYAVQYPLNERLFICCVACGRDHYGTGKIGYWMPPGEVSLIPLPLEDVIRGRTWGFDLR